MRRLVLASLCLTCTTLHAEPLLSCDKLVVQYSEPNLVPLDRHVSVRSISGRPAEVPEETDPEFKPRSPHNTAAFIRTRVADTMHPGPYSNSIQVFTTRGAPLSWQIDIVDLKDNVRLRWLNEELLFIQAWWGRLVETDLIFNVGTGKFLYTREAYFGPWVQPCEEPHPSVKGTSGGKPADVPHVER